MVEVIGCAPSGTPQSDLLCAWRRHASEKRLRCNASFTWALGVKRMTTEIFQTKRLRCRLWDQEDLESIYAVYSDEVGSRWVGDGQPISREETIRWMDVTFENYSNRGYGMSTVVEKTTGEVVGFCGLVHPDGQKLAEIKYAFKKTHWGLGYASEIVPEMISYGNTVHGLSKIIATVAQENEASQRVLQKSNMIHSGEYEEGGHRTLVYEWHGE